MPRALPQNLTETCGTCYFLLMEQGDTRDTGARADWPTAKRR